MKALDSKTRSGKMIDRVMAELKTVDRQVMKTNLFDVDYFPLIEQRDSLIVDWYSRVEPTRNDILVLLGDSVHWNFPDTIIARKIIKVPHPSSPRSHEKMNAYVVRVSTLINKEL